MPRYDRVTGKLIDPNAPIKPSTVADSVPELNTPPIEPPEEPKEPAPAPAPDPIPATPSGTFTLQDVMAIVQQMNKPNDVELFRYEQDKKKVEQEREAQIARAKRAVEAAEIEQRVRSAGQSTCSHTKLNGKTAFAGQVNSDGYWRPLCVACFKMLPKVKAPQEWLTGGINTQAGPDVAGAMAFLNERTLLAWHRSTVPNCQETCCKPVRELVAV